MKTFRYELDKSSKKFSCPSCSKKRFVRYIDYNSEQYLPSHFGRCDRETSCGYSHPPYNDFRYKKESFIEKPFQPKKIIPVFIPKQLFNQSLNNYEKNNFIRFLRRHYDSKAVKKLVQTYKIGTSHRIKGGCIFYQIDINGNIRRGKIIVYNIKTGKRGTFNSVHNLLKNDKENYPEWRLFGEHLLKDNDKPVAIVESEKTALIASIYFPEFVWLATGTKSTLKIEYAQSLKGKSVTLFPDIGAYEDWSKKMESFSTICSISISDLLERKSGALEKSEGLDLADYLINRHISEFNQC